MLKEGGQNGLLCICGPVRNVRPRWDDLLMTSFTKINHGIINALKRCLCINDAHILDKLVLCLDVCYTKANTSACGPLNIFAVKKENVKKRLQLQSQRKAANLTFPCHSAASVSVFNPKASHCSHWTVATWYFCLLFARIRQRHTRSNPASHPNVCVKLAEHRRRWLYHNGRLTDGLVNC